MNQHKEKNRPTNHDFYPTGQVQEILLTKILENTVKSPKVSLVDLVVHSVFFSSGGRDNSGEGA